MLVLHFLCMKLLTETIGTLSFLKTRAYSLKYMLTSLIYN